MVLPDNFFDVQFGKAMAFGYKTEDVDDFVTKAIDAIKGQQEEIEILQEKLGVLAGELEKYREEEDSLRSALIGAQKLGDSILKDSKSKAEVILRDATLQANHIIEEAHGRLEQEKREYDLIKAEVSSFRERLIAMYKVHIDQIAKIPHQAKAQSEAQVQEPQAPAPAAEEVAPAVVPAAAGKAPTPSAAVPQASTPAAEAPRPEPAAVQQPAQRRAAPAIQLELVENDEEEESAVVASFSSKVDRIISQEPTSVHTLYGSPDFDDEDEDDEAPREPGPVISSKFGVLKFGDNFDLQGDDEPHTRTRK